MRAFCFNSIVLACVLVTSSYGRAENGVSNDSIIIGQSIVESGQPESVAYDKLFKKGSSIVFEKVNSQGGVHGRKIKLIYRNDGFEPKRAVENTRDFITQDKVYCLFGYFGSPASTAVRPIFQSHDVPYIAPFSGLDLLRNPVDKNAFLVRVSATEEAQALVDYAVEKLKLKRIAILHREDAFGDSGRRGVVAALLKKDLRPVAMASFKFGDDKALQPAMKTLLDSKADGIIVWSTTEPTAIFLKLLRAAGNTRPVLGPTNTARQETLDQAGAASENFFATFALPLAGMNAQYPIVTEFLEDLKETQSSHIDPYEFEGYVNARVFVEALKRAGPKLTRQSLRQAFEEMHGIQIGGLNLNFSATNHQGLSKVFMARAKDGKYQPLE